MIYCKRSSLSIKSSYVKPFKARRKALLWLFCADHLSRSTSCRSAYARLCRWYSIWGAQAYTYFWGYIETVTFVTRIWYLERRKFPRSPGYGVFDIEVFLECELFNNLNEKSVRLHMLLAWSCFECHLICCETYEPFWCWLLHYQRQCFATMRHLAATSWSWPSSRGHKFVC